MSQLTSAFTSAHGAKDSKFEVSIGSLDEPSKSVFAQYRPKELDVQQTVPWTKHTNKSPDGSLQLEFSGADGRDASIELFFDASEISNGSVQNEIDKLTELATVRDPTSTKDEMKRPHHCVMVFGNVYKKRPFTCVITSMATKFTMFSPTGDPIRATVSLKLKEMHLAKQGKAEPSKEKSAFEEEGVMQSWLAAAKDRESKEFTKKEQQDFIKSAHLSYDPWAKK
jgi:hypothetical protein